ncbi:MAG TPA: hypothetical protein VEZ72_08455, partial [Paenibacillus sp.]|nr:hypothetical protein [Paenibacillus sp.]
MVNLIRHCRLPRPFACQLHRRAALSASQRCNFCTIAVHLIRHGPLPRTLCLPIAPPCSTFCTMAVQYVHHRGALHPPQPPAAHALPVD